MKHDWLNLIEVSGPFLAVPVLEEVFPQGLEGLETSRAQRLRRAHEEWREAVDADDPALDDLHRAWIDEVLATALEMDEGLLRRGCDVPDRLQVALLEHGVTLSPDLALVDPSHGDAPLLLVHILEPDADLDATRRFDGLASTPAERMVMLLRGAGCPVGLVTNGERWMLVHAPVGSVASYASWYARLWGQEPETLRAFVSLLGVRRFFGPEDERLPALYGRSLKHQDDVTDALGEQVRRAVEVLVQAVDRADQDRNRELLRDTDPRELYEAALTVMMRLVFLLAAEERGLLLLNDERYDAHYALSTLRMQLRGESEEILERRRSAWSRLLALFRAVYGGIEHPALRLPPLGGSLFDPDRYPFLEGRTAGTSWRTHLAEPLPIDDRTVLLLLEAIQTFQGRTLSYRALDVEQIGHVYEGLLERTVKRVEDVTLELDATAKAKDPRVALGELESAALEGNARVVKLLEERSQRSPSALRNTLDLAPDARLNARLLTVCRGDVSLRDRILPYAQLLRTDPWGYPLVHHAGAFVVVLGADRRETGTHYTPKSLTEKIVEETLTPLVYRGPAEGVPREEWELKRPDELLALKVCDPAMGSAAFLVQVCRFLSERLVEAWAREEAEGRVIDVEGRIRAPDESFEPMSADVEERAVTARRLVAERCLYGVDLNPLAVELAKLSLWLVTLAKGRPFNFLDHHLKSGDSLLGIHSLDQLTQLSMTPAGGRQLRLFGQTVERAVEEATELRQLIASVPVRDIRDVNEMAGLEAEAREKLGITKSLADAFIGTVFGGGSERELELRLSVLAAEADRAVRGDVEALSDLKRWATAAFSKDAPDGKARRPFHWPLAFPEVFNSDDGGFDAFVGNPPFLTGKRISTQLGSAYQDFLKRTVPESKGAADLVVYFFRRAYLFLCPTGILGMIGTKSIAEGDSRLVGLKWLLDNGASIPWAEHEIRWPGSASVVVSLLTVSKADWVGTVRLGSQVVSRIGSQLSVADQLLAEPHALVQNKGRRSDGIKIQGDGFIISDTEREALIRESSENSDVISRYITGIDIAQGVCSSPSAWIINFGTLPRVAAERYRGPFRILEERVKPYRDQLTGQIHEADFWKFWDKRESFFAAMAGKGRILACPSTSKYLLMTFIDENWVPSHSIKLFAFASDDAFIIMQSAVHEVWARHRSGKLGQTLAYNLSKSFATFPWPFVMPPSRAGRELLQLRQDTCSERQICLTDLYNEMHNPRIRAYELDRLRELHLSIDQDSVRAYGWDDLNLDHDFHEVPYLPVNDRMRFTISEPARIEVLRRLTDLNRQRYEEEVARGLHGKASSKGGTRKQSTRTSAKQAKAASVQQTGFDFGTSSARSAHAVDGEPAQAILDYLRAHSGWHAKSDVLGATGLTDGQWNTTIGDLVTQGHVKRKGQKRGTRYRLAEEVSS